MLIARGSWKLQPEQLWKKTNGLAQSLSLSLSLAEVEGAKPLPDGLFLGGSFESAQAGVRGDCVMIMS